MTLLIACLLISGFGFSPAWYFVAAIIWMGHLVWVAAISSAVAQQGANHILRSMPGIRGTITGGKPNE